jgi:FkbM family methyltransferase
MNFSGIPNKSLLGKLLRLPLRLLPASLAVPVLQGPVRGKKWVIGSGKHGYWLGSYEFENQKALAGLISPGTVVFDIGASVGFYTLLAAQRTGSAGRVFAFEPLPRNLHYIRQHLALNRIANVTVIEAAVSERSGAAFFNPGVSISTGFLSDSGEIQVRTVSLDELYTSGELPAPSVVKIDAEGAEGGILRGACHLLSETRPVIFLSTHKIPGGGTTRDECAAVLQPLGYRLEPVSPAQEFHSARDFIARPASQTL